MKKSIFYGHIVTASEQRHITKEEVLEKAKIMGFDGLEIEHYAINKELSELMKCTDFEASCVYKFFQFGRGFDPDEIERFLYDASSVGSHKAMIIPGDFDETDRTIQLNNMAEGLKYICDSAEKYGITVAIEDFDSNKSPCMSVDGLQWFFNEIPELKWVFDTGNFLYSGQDVMLAFEKLKSRLCHIHLKDRLYEPFYPQDRPGKAINGHLLYPCPAGYGILPIRECIESAVKCGYDDYVVFEHFGASDQLDFINKDALLNL